MECTYPCGVLNNTFTKTYNLKVHQGVHAGEVSYHRDGCNETFSKAYSLKVHKDVHTGERLYCCDVLIKHLQLQNWVMFDIFTFVTFVELLTV